MSFFRCSLEVDDFGYNSLTKNEISLTANTENPISILIEFVQSSKWPDQSDPALVTATTEVIISESTEADLKKYLNVENVIDFNKMSEESREIVRNIYDQLSKSLLSAISILRWRTGTRGGNIRYFSDKNITHLDMPKYHYSGDGAAAPPVGSGDPTHGGTRVEFG